MNWAETVLILFVNLLISFAAGCATHKESYIRALKTPLAMLICVVCQFVVRPAVVFGLMIAFGVPDEAAVGCLLCAMAPGGNGSNLLEIIFRGNIELGIVCTLCSSVCAAVAIPIDFYLYAQRFSDKSFTFVTMPWKDISSAISCVVLGAAAGAVVRYRDDRLGHKLEHRTAAVGLVLLVAAVLVAVVSNVKALESIPSSAWMATIFHCPISMTCSYYPARWSGMKAVDARTVATEVGECNIGVAYAILLLLYNDEETRRKTFAGIIAYTVFNEVYIFGAALYWRFVDPIDARCQCATTELAPDHDGKQDDAAKDDAVLQDEHADAELLTSRSSPTPITLAPKSA